MSPHYPYPSKNKKDYARLKEGQHYSVWHKAGVDLQELLAKVTKPIIEIAGPTNEGYYFLDKQALPVPITITNISKRPPGLDEALIQELVDGRKMSYKNGSVGMFLMSGMSITSDWYLELSEKEMDAKKEQIDMEFDVARMEMQHVALGMLDPSNVRYAQRVPIYLEVYRALAPGGLFMTDGSLEEMDILQRIGFELVAMTQEFISEQNWIYNEVVARKRPLV